MSTTAYGESVDGLALTDALITRLFHEAEKGHDLERLKLRVRPGRPAPLPIGTPIEVEFSAELLDRASRVADTRGVSLNEFIRQVLRGYIASAS